MDFHQIINAIVLGIVEGITEFLPVSSTGHLILFNQWFYFPNAGFTKVFDIVIQTGAILAVVVLFRKRIFPVYRSQSKDDRKRVRDLWLKAIIGVIPAIIIGVILESKINQYLFNPYVVAVALVVWGIVIILVDGRKNPLVKYETVNQLTIPIVVAIGFIQCLALIPGTSRSAATIVGAMLLGSGRVAAAEFSFFLAIPTLIGASAYDLYKAGFHLSGHEYALIAIGFVVSFLVAWAVIAAFMRFVSRHDFRPFGWYRVALGVAVILYFGLSGAMIR